jgi:type II secretory pathway pseudopilin PulG
MNTLRRREQKNCEGFTLIEICVALGLASLILVALADVNTLSSRATQASNAADEFNSDLSLLLTLVNATAPTSSPPAAPMSGCTLAFQGMQIVGGLPAVSTATIAWPSTVPNFIAAMAVAPAAIAIYQNYSTSTGPIIQVGAPTFASANAFFPAPRNNLWITNIQFTSQVDSLTLAPPTDLAGAVANIYDLHIDAQKVSTGMTIFGGATTFSKDVLVTLWIIGTAVVYCGGNPT